MARRYVSDWQARFETTVAGRKKVYSFLWGESVEVLGRPRGGRVAVRAWGMEGTMDPGQLGDRPLLEIYVIDVGQGDGILVHTPDDRWHMVDGGKPRSTLQLGKGAANFIRWKFRTHLGRDTVALENVVITHSDFDHYGGVIDVLGGDFGLRAGDPPLPVDVENLYHCGVGRFAGRAEDELGRVERGSAPPFPRHERGIPRDGEFITELLDGKTSFRRPPRPFKREFGDLARLVAKVPRNVQRLSHRDTHLKGYGRGENDVAISVLGPVLEDIGGNRVGLRRLGTSSVTANGHSIVLRLDYDLARILLTGDLNDRSQKLLLSYMPEEDFAVDVAKACHHGSEDIDLAFVKAMRPRSTVISSGDNESFSHPRPFAMGASARYGREGVDATTRRQRVLPPLVYSTELARSVRLENAARARVQAEDGERELSPDLVDVRSTARDAKFRSLERTPLSTDLIYGLVNVRTDGRSILCGTLREDGAGFDVQVFKAGESPTGVG